MNKYRKYTKETQSYMEEIETYLTSKYGSVKDSWNLTLKLLADNIEYYKKCKESVEENGIYNKVSGRKNPLLSTMKDYQATITKQIQHLGISPYAESKIKDGGEEDDIPDFLKD